MVASTADEALAPGQIAGEVNSDEIEGVQMVLTRHRSNPYGTWVQISSPADRKDRNYHVVAQLADGSWWRVTFHKGRIEGAKDKAPRKTDGYAGNENGIKKR